MLTADNWSIFVWHQPTYDSRRDLLHRAFDLLEPSAYAYSCTEILRVMLAEQFWVPDPASWAILTSLTGSGGGAGDRDAFCTMTPSSGSQSRVRRS